MSKIRIICYQQTRKKNDKEKRLRSREKRLKRRNAGTLERQNKRYLHSVYYITMELMCWEVTVLFTVLCSLMDSVHLYLFSWVAPSICHVLYSSIYYEAPVTQSSPLQHCLWWKAAFPFLPSSFPVYRCLFCGAEPWLSLPSLTSTSATTLTLILNYNE